MSGLFLEETGHHEGQSDRHQKTGNHRSEVTVYFHLPFRILRPNRKSVKTPDSPVAIEAKRSKRGNFRSRKKAAVGAATSVVKKTVAMLKNGLAASRRSSFSTAGLYHRVWNEEVNS